MNADEVIRKYCNTCIHRKDCWRPCMTTIAALYTGSETVEHLEEAMRRARQRTEQKGVTQK